MTVLELAIGSPMYPTPKEISVAWRILFWSGCLLLAFIRCGQPNSRKPAGRDEGGGQFNDRSLTIIIENCTEWTFHPPGLPFLPCHTGVRRGQTSTPPMLGAC